MVIFGGDLNGHVGRAGDGFEDVHGGYGVGVKNFEGERILEFGVALDMKVCGTQFKKDDSQLITYSSGGLNTAMTTSGWQQGSRKTEDDVETPCREKHARCGTTGGRCGPCPVETIVLERQPLC